MPKELTDLKITHVSYVDKGANGKRFFLMKSEDKAPAYEKEFDIIVKSEDEKRLVYGAVYEPNTLDEHGEFAKAKEIEKAAHRFMEDYRNIDLQHNFISGVGEVVENYIAPADFEIKKQAIKKGTWIIVTKASEEVWEAIKKGEITGYSMAGYALRKEADDIEADEMKTSENKKAFSENDAKGFFDVMKSFFMQSKAENNEDERENEMKKEELTDVLKSAIAEAVTPLTEAVKTLEGTLQKEAQAEEAEAYDANEVVSADVIKSVVTDALSPLTKRITALEKAKGVSKQLVEKEAMSGSRSIFAGIEL